MHRIAWILLAALLLPLAACDSTDDGTIPAGLAATVDGQAFRAGFVMGDRFEPGVVTVSGGVTTASPLAPFRQILLFVPAQVGTYTAADDRASAGYSVIALADSSFQTWRASGTTPGSSLEIRVTDVDEAHVEGTFAFTAVGTEDTPGTVRVTGGTFNVGIGSGRSASPAPLPPARP